MMHFIQNLRKLSYSSEEKYLRTHSLDCVYIRQRNTVYSHAVQSIGQWKKPQIFPFPAMSVHKGWKLTLDHFKCSSDH